MQFSFNLVALKQLQEKIDARIMRERILLFFAAIATVFMLWNFMIQAPFEQKKQALNTQLKYLATQSVAVQTQITAATHALMNDPVRLKKIQITQLQTDIAGVELQLQNSSQGLINAEQLPQVLQDVLQKTTQLTLLEVITLPSHELNLVSVNMAANNTLNNTLNNTNTLNSTANNANTPVENSLGIYEHVVELRVAGSYFQVVQFITALEALPWRFYWQRLDYAVTQYPNAEIILRVYTLSSEEGLLGV